MHPDVRTAVPRSAGVVAVALAWVRAGALAGVLVAIGRGVDALAGGASAVPAAGAVAVLGALAAAASAAEKIAAARVRSRAEGRLRRRIVDSVFRQGLVAAQSRSGALLDLATGSVERAARYRGAFLGPTIGALTTPLVVLAITAWTVDPLVAGLLAIATAVAPLVIIAAQRAVRPAGAGHRRAQMRLTAAFLSSVQGLSTLVAARAADRAAADLAKRGEQHRRSLMRILAVNQTVILVIDAVVSIGVVLLAVVLAAARIDSGAMSLGAGVATVLIALLVTAPADLTGQFFYIGIGGRASEQAIGRQLSRTPQAASRASGHSPSAAEADARPDTADAPDTAAIVLDGVTAGWTAERPVLAHRSMRIERGEHVALVGPSGAGKSTVSALLQAHLVPAEGTVEVAGVDTRMSPAECRRRISVVEQRTFLFQGTVAENLRLARPSASDAELWSALDEAGLAGEIRASDLGLDTPVGEHGTRLSGGQSQRLAIARATLRDAPVLILDEPTSQVDLAGEAAFLDSLGRLASGRTVLMIAHRPGAVLAADRVIALDGPGDRG